MRNFGPVVLRVGIITFYRRAVAFTCQKVDCATTCETCHMKVGKNKVGNLEFDWLTSGQFFGSSGRRTLIPIETPSCSPGFSLQKLGFLLNEAEHTIHPWTLLKFAHLFVQRLLEGVSLYTTATRELAGSCHTAIIPVSFLLSLPLKDQGSFADPLDLT